MEGGGLLKDSWRVGQAVVRVLGDSTKTHEIHRVEVIWEDQWELPLGQVRAAYRVHALERRWLA